MSGPSEPGQRSGGSSGRGRRARGTDAAACLELDADRIKELLDRLDARLRTRGIAAELYVVGGAAVLAATGLRRVTRDVDVAYLDPAVAHEARLLGAEEGLPADWLSSAAGAWAPPGHHREPSAAGPGLTVRYATGEELLAMKMIALRTQDAPDIVALAAMLGLRGEPAERFAALLRRVYPDDNALALLLGVPDPDLDQEVSAVTTAVARLTSTPA